MEDNEMSAHETPEVAVEQMPHLDCDVSRIVALDEERRQVKHVISTARLDRANRIVEPGGWRIARYRANPVVLADHDYSIERIIGRAVETKVEGDALVSTTEFAKEGLGNVAFRLVQQGLARAWSVGWMGLKRHRIGEVEDCERCKAAGAVQYGTHFVQQELLEYSLVAVPANPDVTMSLCAAGLCSRDECEAWDREFAAPPERTSAFYDAVFSASRDAARRAAALQVSRRIHSRSPQ